MAMAMALGESMGFRPTDDEIIRLFLRRKIAGDPLHGVSGTFIHDADVCSAEPAKLTAEHAPASGDAESGVWFFFSPVRYRKNGRGRRSRMVGSVEGCWHSEAAAKALVDATGRRVGYRQSFSYRCKNGVKPGWLMVEFGADQEDGDGEAPALVVCKVYKSPRAPRAEEAVAVTSGGKRKAADGNCPEEAPPAARRRQGRDDVLDEFYWSYIARAEESCV